MRGRRVWAREPGRAHRPERLQPGSTPPNVGPSLCWPGRCWAAPALSLCHEGASRVPLEPGGRSPDSGETSGRTQDRAWGVIRWFWMWGLLLAADAHRVLTVWLCSVPSEHTEGETWPDSPAPTRSSCAEGAAQETPGDGLVPRPCAQT